MNKDSTAQSCLALADEILHHRVAIQPLSANYFREEAVQSLKSRRLLVPEDMIRSQVRQMAEVRPVLGDRPCIADGFPPKLKPTQLGPAMEAREAVRLISKQTRAGLNNV